VTGFYSQEAYRSSSDDSWTTPRTFFDSLNREFDFTLDAAALKSSALCNRWYGPDHDSLDMQDAFSRDWQQDAQGNIWLNPPYGRTIKSWMQKANLEASRGGGQIVCLVPSRTDTTWWHENCIQHEVRFIRGRLKFGNQKNPAPFPSAVVIMRGKSE
jgi:phage N-6-adenine-methyltransferase